MTTEGNLITYLNNLMDFKEKMIFTKMVELGYRSSDNMTTLPFINMSVDLEISNMMSGMTDLILE